LQEREQRNGEARRQVEARLEEVRGLLSRADRRAREFPEERRRWLGVIEHLESTLLEIRVRLNALNAEASMLQQGLAEALAGHVPVLQAVKGEVALENQAASSLPGSLSDSSISLARKVLQMPVEALHKLSLEEMTQLHSQIGAENVLASSPEVARLMGRVELANQGVGVSQAAQEEAPADSPERRRQLALRAAIEKIQRNRIDQMTPEEVKMTVACYDLVCRRMNPTPTDKHLKRVLGAAISILRRKQAEQGR